MALANTKDMSTRKLRNLYLLKLTEVKYLSLNKNNSKIKEYILNKKDKYGDTNIYPNPSLLFEIRFGNQIIPLNSSFLNPNERDRYKLSLFPNFADLYDTFIFTKKKDHYMVNLTEKETNKSENEQIKDLWLAHAYYQSQNDNDAYKFSNILQQFIYKLTALVQEKSYFFPEKKIWIKRIPEENKNWFYTQKWISRKYVIEPGSNFEKFTKFKVSDSILEWYGFYEQIDLTEKNKFEIQLSLHSSVKIRNFVSYMIKQYDKSLSQSILEENQNLEGSKGKLFADDLYIEKLDGIEVRISVNSLFEKYTKNKKEYLIKYIYIISDD